MKLTIAIPTFDRNEILRRNLSVLLPQLDSSCTLLILDNCSPIPVAVTLAELLSAHPRIDCRIVRHPVNIGGNANIVRCFELCETEWLWMLSDAFAVLPGAVRTIFRTLEEFKGSYYINFATEQTQRPRTIVTEGVDGFIEAIDDFGAMLMISTCVFRASELRPDIRYGYHYSYTLAPHLAMLLTSLGSSAACCLSRERILGVRGDVDNPWSLSLYPYLLGLRELPLAPETLDRLVPKLRAETDRYLLKIVGNLTLLSLEQGDSRRGRYKFDLFRFRRFYGTRAAGDRLKFFGLRLLVMFPRLGSLVVRVAAGKSRGGLQIPSDDGF